VQSSSQIDLTIITTNKPSPRFFTGWTPYPSPNQQHQSTEGTEIRNWLIFRRLHRWCVFVVVVFVYEKHTAAVTGRECVYALCRQKKHVRSNVRRAISRMMIHHIGTAVLGSIIITITSVPRAITGFFSDRCHTRALSSGCDNYRKLTKSTEKYRKHIKNLQKTQY